MLPEPELRRYYTADVSSFLCGPYGSRQEPGLQIIREMLGHTDMAATQIYAEFQPGITTEYRKAHPRG